MAHRCLFLAVALALIAGTAFGQNKRDIKVRNDRSEFEDSDFWIYNDLPRGLAEAKAEKKPLLVVFRCIP